jgi:hypothetical protein
VAPFLIAHRAGNDLARLRRAERVRPGLIEADVHLFRGRLEVRHLKTLGPLAVLWDRWYLAPPGTRRLELHELLAATDTALMLDLKGGRRLGRRVAAALGGRPVTICSRRWSALEPFAGLPHVRVVHSVGSRRQLRALRRRGCVDGISIHRRLLDRATVADLRRRAGLIMSWPVASAEEAALLAGWGVDGVITERYEELA